MTVTKKHWKCCIPDSLKPEPNINIWHYYMTYVKEKQKRNIKLRVCMNVLSNKALAFGFNYLIFRTCSCTHTNTVFAFVHPSTTFGPNSCKRIQVIKSIVKTTMSFSSVSLPWWISIFCFSCLNHIWLMYFYWRIRTNKMCLITGAERERVTQSRLTVTQNWRYFAMAWKMIWALI